MAAKTNSLKLCNCKHTLAQLSTKLLEKEKGQCLSMAEIDLAHSQVVIYLTRTPMA